VGGVAGDLVFLQVRVPYGEYLLDKQLRQAPQDGKLVYVPPLFQIKPRERIVKILALIIHGVVMGNALIARFLGAVVLIADEHPAAFWFYEADDHVA